MSKRPTSKKSDAATEKERLNSLVRLDGKGEDPAVRAMLSEEFVRGSNSEALEIALALQQVIRGQNSILANQEEMQEEQRRIRARMDAMDKAVEAWNTDREKFAQDVFDRADKLKVTGAEKEKLIARSAISFQEEVSKARAERNTDNLKFMADLERMPKVKVVSPGVHETVIENGQPIAKLQPEVIRIKNKVWVLPPGKEVEVPQIVADRLAQLRLSQEENEARKTLLARNLEADKLSGGWAEINRKYNSSTERIPI